jgi:hypothetical protein
MPQGAEPIPQTEPIPQAEPIPQGTEPMPQPEQGEVVSSLRELQQSESCLAYHRRVDDLQSGIRDLSPYSELPAEPSFILQV